MRIRKQLLQNSFMFVVHVSVSFVYQHRMVVGRFTRFPAKTEIRKWWYLFVRLVVYCTLWVCAHETHVGTRYYQRFYIPSLFAYTLVTYISKHTLYICVYFEKSNKSTENRLDKHKSAEIRLQKRRSQIRRCSHITQRLRKRDVHICELHTVHKIQTEDRMLCHWESGELPRHLLIADCTVSRCLFIRFGHSVDGMCAFVWQSNNDAAPSAPYDTEWTGGKKIEFSVAKIGRNQLTTPVNDSATWPATTAPICVCARVEHRELAALFRNTWKEISLKCKYNSKKSTNFFASLSFALVYIVFLFNYLSSRHFCAATRFQGTR